MKVRQLTPLLVIVAGLLAYHNSFTGGYVFDDVRSIPENPTIRHLWPIGQCLSPPQRDWLTVEGRPLINLSLAINYALGGSNVWGYHALNLAVHILAGLTLLGIVRRTLLQPALRERFGAPANELALAIALLLTVHPLQTESVTYMIQRAESIMGLFYLLTLYCFIRGAASVRAGLWYGLSATACALGMASKEVMVTAPLMVLLYDRAFLSGSFRETWRRRWRLSLGLAATWIVLGFVLVSAGVFTYASMTAQRTAVKWWQYLATEPGVILYYLRLSLWPSPLCLNHPWPIVRTWTSLLPSAVVVVLLWGTSVWAWKRNRALGFAGAWFFLILVPTSTVIPLEGPFYEHRMYLPLAAVVSLVVMGLSSLVPTLRSGRVGRKGLTVFVAAAIGLGFLTARRNRDYRNEITICADAVAKFPNETLPHYNLAVSLGRAGRIEEAITQYGQALQINPDFGEAQYNLALALAQVGRVEEAIGYFEQAMRPGPGSAEANYNLGLALVRAGRAPEAIRYFQETVRLTPEDAEAQNNLAVALIQQGRIQEAIGHWEQALRITPDDAEVHYNLGNALLALGKAPEAAEHYEQALRLKPDFVEAQKRLASLRAEPRR